MKKIYILFFACLFMQSTDAQILLSESFEIGSTFPANGWKRLKTVGKDWVRNDLGPIADGPHNFPKTGTNCMVYEYDVASRADAWMITPTLALTNGIGYKISFWYRIRSATFPENLKITIGNDSTIAAQTTVLWDNAGGGPLTNLTHVQANIAFNASSTGNFFVGFNCYNPLDDGWALIIDDIVIERTTPLPVNSFQFSGISKDNNNVLKWVTTAEINNKGFEILKSNDGKMYSSIAFVNPNETVAAINNYDFIDTKTATAAYYKIKQIDKDGKFTLSNIVFLKGKKSTKFELNIAYPNPVSNTLNLILNALSNTKVSVLITDLSGKVLQQQVASLIDGENNIQLNVEKISKGNYIVKIIDSFGTPAFTKFIKQ